uniref:LOV domain-containing protein n=1 Tax=Odontella aurita TaxID=265563 RepID=A0A7S4JP98_9STRA|mmetsp:Transcript_5077/g.14595  ORF Transcript_5077/g.14595 Transcript_5077/m.14595 type:complete len:886 (+) Transcript_5077:477-3134(+)
MNDHCTDHFHNDKGAMMGMKSLQRSLSSRRKRGRRRGEKASGHASAKTVASTPGRLSGGGESDLVALANAELANSRRMPQHKEPAADPTTPLFTCISDIDESASFTTARSTPDRTSEKRVNCLEQVVPIQVSSSVNPVKILPTQTNVEAEVDHRLGRMREVEAENVDLKLRLRRAEEDAEKHREENADLRRRLAETEVRLTSTYSAAAAAAAAPTLAPVGSDASFATHNDSHGTIPPPQHATPAPSMCGTDAADCNDLLSLVGSPAPSHNTALRSPTSSRKPERRNIVEAVEYVDRVLRRISMSSVNSHTLHHAERTEEEQAIVPPQMVTILSESNLKDMVGGEDSTIGGVEDGEEKKDESEDLDNDYFFQDLGDAPCLPPSTYSAPPDDVNSGREEDVTKASSLERRTSENDEHSLGIASTPNHHIVTTAGDTPLTSNNRVSPHCKTDERIFVSSAGLTDNASFADVNADAISATEDSSWAPAGFTRDLLDAKSVATRSVASGHDGMSCFHTVREEAEGNDSVVSHTKSSLAGQSLIRPGQALLQKADNVKEAAFSAVGERQTNCNAGEGGNDDCTSAGGSWMAAGDTGRLFDNDDASASTVSTWDTMSTRRSFLQSFVHGDGAGKGNDDENSDDEDCDCESLSAISGITDLQSEPTGRVVSSGGRKGGKHHHDPTSEVMWELYRVKNMLGSLLEETPEGGDPEKEQKQIVPAPVPTPAPTQVKVQPTPPPVPIAPEDTTLREPDFRLMSALAGNQQNFAISDPSQPDNPIVYVSQGFCDLTGYTLDQVLGRNCRFLQGPGTDPAAVDIIRRGIDEGRDASVCLLNYKADGTTFWNQFFVAALRDAEGKIVNYVGVQCEVSRAAVDKQIEEGRIPSSAIEAAKM